MELVIIVSLQSISTKELSTYIRGVIDINSFKFTFTVVFNYLGVDDVEISYLWTPKIFLGLGLGVLSCLKVCFRLTSLVIPLRIGFPPMHDSSLLTLTQSDS